MSIAVFYFPIDNVINFEINLTLLIKLFSYITKKNQEKDFNILRTKGCVKMKQKVFFINFKGLSLNILNQLFWKI